MQSIQRIAIEVRKVMVNIVPNNVQVEDDRTGLNVATLKRAFLDNLFYVQAKFPKIATKNDYYMALAYTVRDRLINCWRESMWRDSISLMATTKSMLNGSSGCGLLQRNWTYR